MDNDKPRRVLSIYKLFLTNRELSSNEVKELLPEEFQSATLRTIQRDLNILYSEDFLDLTGQGRNSSWRIKSESIGNLTPFKLKGNELLSFYILKAYLNNFKGTHIENDISELTKKLDTLAPGNVFLDDLFYNDQNNGYYDYSGKPGIIGTLIEHISKKNWISMKYERLLDGEIQEYKLFPYFLFTYAGTIYLAAYNPTRRIPASFAIQNIQEIEKSYEIPQKTPRFNFDEFKNQRFGVYDGEIKRVSITVRSKFIKYFENRFWHPSAKSIKDQDGNLIIKMNVPLSPDLISWIIHWSEGISDIKPDELKKKVVETLEKSLGNLKK